MTLAPSLLPTLQRVQTLLQSRRGVEAWDVIAPLRASIDNEGQALRLYALAAQAAGRPQDAIGALRRIAQLERDPPDILGALADALGKAGQHDEALSHWDALVARHPDIADAHLNRAVTAANSGRHDLAVEAADAGLARFPGHARLLAVKAMAMKNAGRIDESVKLFEIAVAADPNRALTRHNQAVALRAACRFEEACEAFAASEKLGMKGAQFHANWAAAALEGNRVGQAEALYLKALTEDAGHEESRKGLTRLRIEYRGGDRAFAHYEAATRKEPGKPGGWLAWANALIANRQIAAAQEVAERGLAANPASPELSALRTFARGMLGDASQALDELDSTMGDQPAAWPLASLVAEIALRAGRPRRAAEILEPRTTAEPGDQLAWSMLSLAWRLLEDPREHWLCDYDRLVMTTEVAASDGSISPVDYAGDVATVLDALHVTEFEPGDQSLRGGTQTSGALFARPDPAIQQFRAAVTQAAERAVAELPDDPTHPFLRRKSSRLGFSGSWSVRLKPGGHHVSHIHPEGWMSSAYYARLPTDAAEATTSHEGWIQFGVPPAHLGLDMAPRRVVEPRPGRLVLFPSYMWHGTIPFAAGDRLTAAFDYLPL